MRFQLRSGWSILLTFKKIGEMTVGKEAAATTLVGDGRKIERLEEATRRALPFYRGKQ